jgi:hypothetical protein
MHLLTFTPEPKRVADAASFAAIAAFVSPHSGVCVVGARAAATAGARGVQRIQADWRIAQQAASPQNQRCHHLRPGLHLPNVRVAHR